MRHLLPPLFPVLLSACAVTPPPAARPAMPAAPPGLEALMGKPAEAAEALLGPTALDRREGMARQLQFVGACILDLFYLPRGEGAPVAAHAEARLPNGQPVPPGDCLAALVRARRPG